MSKVMQSYPMQWGLNSGGRKAYNVLTSSVFFLLFFFLLNYTHLQEMIFRISGYNMT